MEATVTGDMDPGYGSTSKMIAESALCIVQDCEAPPRRICQTLRVSIRDTIVIVIVVLIISDATINPLITVEREDVYPLWVIGIETH